ncbi:MULTISPECIES: ornithine cyclodeaminase family protein [Vibrio]|uniref:Ornithine cyclodeaminase family protein n=1 Tax=Vibrio anguillarum TaxID=55601 RepID=A0ABD4QYZ6_VIBAN|nr:MULTISPECIES: ornithine cyclodeaminase family protein [Vibrio]ASG04900.1 ornithine cyclodeaminase family protein [Vibrio anguillarum]ASG05788.1 ornithine cyclodeaminase family protein [Vibrio anguillarum]MBT2920294.1 ornithine cyclodeaminase family protein [Vibrio anguillarum]NNN98466.1 ornithine cyclodeaminase family protein [Vibrio sp. B1-2]
MIYLNEQQTSQLISHQLAYDAVKEAFIAAVSDEATLFPVVNAAGSQEGSMFSLKSACTSNLVGWKTGTYWPNNRALDMPCHGTTVFLLKPDTGELQAAIAASKVNAYRTAAADAVAVDYLARKDSKVLTVFGTGHQAEFEVLAICDIRKIEKVLVVGRSNTEVFVEKLKQQGINAESASAQTACEQADIIVTATTAQSPLFNAQWVKSGTHISAMGADKFGKQELPPELYNTARLFCDYRIQSVAIGEFQHTVNLPVTEIGQVITGNAQGRKTDKEITVFDSSGIAIQDLFVAAKLLDLVDRKAAE